MFLFFLAGLKANELRIAHCGLVEISFQSRVHIAWNKVVISYQNRLFCPVKISFRYFKSPNFFPNFKSSFCFQKYCSCNPSASSQASSSPSPTSPRPHTRWTEGGFAAQSKSSLSLLSSEFSFLCSFPLDSSIGNFHTRYCWTQGTCAPWFGQWKSSKTCVWRSKDFALRFSSWFESKFGGQSLLKF